MRDPIENISQLQKKLNDLQLENQILKTYWIKQDCHTIKNYRNLDKMIVKKLMIWNREKELFIRR